MSLHTQIREFRDHNKELLDKLQISIIAGISSVVYSYYILNAKHKFIKGRMIMYVPTIPHLQQLLDMNSPFMTRLNDELLNNICIDPVYRPKNCPLTDDEFKMVIEPLLSLELLPNASKALLSIIIKRFGLDEKNQGDIQQDVDLKILTDDEINADYPYDYIVHQTYLQMRVAMNYKLGTPYMPPSNDMITLADDNSEIVSIRNSITLCDHLIDNSIMKAGQFNLNILFLLNTLYLDYESCDGKTVLRSGPLNKVLKYKKK